MRKAPIFITTIVIVLVVIGVGVYFFSQRQTAPTQPSAMPDMSQQGQGQNTESSSANQISIENFAFSPATVTIKKGTTITWTNNDSADHTITKSDSKNGPNSPPLAKGQTYSFTFKDAGIFSYVCSLHPNMTGTITVVQ